jgi:hypothetical protein
MLGVFHILDIEPAVSHDASYNVDTTRAAIDSILDAHPAVDSLSLSACANPAFVNTPKQPHCRSYPHQQTDIPLSAFTNLHLNHSICPSLVVLYWLYTKYPVNIFIDNSSASLVQWLAYRLPIPGSQAVTRVRTS